MAARVSECRNLFLSVVKIKCFIYFTLREYALKFQQFPREYFPVGIDLPDDSRVFFAFSRLGNNNSA